jgi:hypothetical protein
MELRPKYGVNLRLKAFDLINQWALMQNNDMAHDEFFRQIKGSVKYHNAILGTNSPSAIIPAYNNDTDTAEVLSSVDDKIVRRKSGQNEFETLIEGLTPGLVWTSAEIENKVYIPHPKDGLFEYDGASKIEKINDILLTDIFLSKETNRAFGITKYHELVWTDSLSSIGGVPISWNPLNVEKIHPTKGDYPVKLWILRGRLCVLMGNSIWIYYINGSPESWRPERCPTVVGVAARKTVKQVGEELWFLGWSSDTGIGLYAFNGQTCRLLSYDIEPYMLRINPERANDAVGELVDNIYKLSFALDASTENNCTFHFDTININPETQTPNIYGPHTYGFNCSAVLDTKKFKGEHLFGRKHSDGGRIFRVANYRTQYSDELSDNGDLIAGILISGIISKEGIGKSIYDQSWFKKYKNIYLDWEPAGSWGIDVEILKGFENETFESYIEYLDGSNLSLEAISADSDALDYQSLQVTNQIEDFVSDSIQLKISNYNVNSTFAFRSMRYDVSPHRRKKYVKEVII